MKDFIGSFFIILGVLVVGLAIMSYDEGIIVSESFFIYYWQNIVSTLITLVVLFLISHSKGYLSTEIENKKLNPFLTGISLVFVTFFVCKYFFEISLPLHLHKLSNKEIVIKQVVVKKISIVFTKGEIFKNKCKYKTIIIRNYKGEICGVPKQLIDNIYEGNELILVGEQSSFGFIPYSVKKK
jgi:hypothetical protein